MTPGASLDAARVGRDGSLRLRFERRGSRTVVTGCRYTLPLQVLAPVALDDPAAVVSILNPTGGLVGGDRLSIDVHAAAGAHAVLTTPSATRVYRTEGEVTAQMVRLSVGPRAVVEWVPDHTIPFAGSALRQTIDVELDETAGLVLVDAFSAGRIALGEAWRFAVLAFDRDRFAADVERLGADGATTRLGVAVLSRRGALVRCLAPTAPALVDAVAGCWRLARRALLGLPPLALRKG